MKKITTTVFVTIMIMMLGVMPVSAETTNSTMEIISDMKVVDSADVNSDGCANILDLIMSKNSGTTGQQDFVTDMLFGKEVSKTCYDLDEMILNPNKTNAFEQLFNEEEEQSINVYQIKDSALIAEFYNRSKHELKRFKLERQYGDTENASKYKEFETNCLWSNEVVVAYLCINRLGQVGWSSDSFKPINSKEVFEVDKMEATIANIARIKSILCGNDFDERICLHDNNVSEVIVRNGRRTVVFKTESTDIPITDWFFRCGQSYNFSVYENFIFGVTEEGKLNINYVC